MADTPYSVGNLQISFSALDKTGKDFADLAKNLRAVVNIINRISTADLGKFTANVKEITRAFTPFLNKINESTAGLQAFNDVARQVGIKNMSAVVTELDEIERKTRNVTESQRELNVEIEDGVDATSKELALYGRVVEAYENVNFVLQEDIDAERAFTEALKENARQALLSINTYDQSSSSMSAYASQWKNLYANMIKNKDLYLSSEDLGESFIERAREQLGELGNEYLRNKQIVDETNEAFRRMFMTEQELALYDFQQENATRKQEIAYYRLMLATGQVGEKAQEYKEELRRLTKEQEKADKVSGKLAKGGFSKLIKQIGRIALYRTIRRGLQMITQTFKESIQAYAQVDDSINKTMTQLTSSTKVISLSLGTIIFPILQAIAPTVKELSYGFANMANTINASLAKMQGLTTYTKINAKALEDYRKKLNNTTNALFDFDKFRALSGQEKSPFLEEAAVADLNEEVGISVAKWTVIYDILHNIGNTVKNVLSLIGQIGIAASPWLLVASSALDFILRIVSGLTSVLEKSGLLVPIMGSILTYLTLIGASKLFTALKVGSLVKWIGAVISLLKEDFRGTLKMLMGDFVKTLTSVKALALGIGALISSIAYLAMNWKDLNNTQRLWIPLASTLIGLVVGVGTALVLSITAIKEALKLNPAAIAKAAITAALFTAAAGIAIGTAISTSKNKANASVAAFADGGIPAQGTLFYAGEAGAEMVYNTPNGQSGVANIQQIAQAVYQGTYQATMDWWKTAKNEIGGDVYLDSEKIYQGVGRAAGKHGKRFADVR